MVDGRSASRVRLRSRWCVSQPPLCQSRRGMRLLVPRARRVEADAAVDAQNAPTAACKTRGRVSHSSHDASLFSCSRSTRRGYNRAHTQGGINPTAATTVATLRRVITITGLGVHDAPESPFKLTGMRKTPPRRRLPLCCLCGATKSGGSHGRRASDRDHSQRRPQASRHRAPAAPSCLLPPQTPDGGKGSCHS